MRRAKKNAKKVRSRKKKSPPVIEVDSPIEEEEIEVTEENEVVDPFIKKQTNIQTF